MTLNLDPLTQREVLWALATIGSLLTSWSYYRENRRLRLEAAEAAERQELAARALRSVALHLALPCDAAAHRFVCASALHIVDGLAVKP